MLTAMRAHETRAVGETYRFLEKTEDADCLQKLIQIVMKGRHLFRSVNVGIQLLGVGLEQRWLLEFGVCVEVTETNPVVERDS